MKIDLLSLGLDRVKNSEEPSVLCLCALEALHFPEVYYCSLLCRLFALVGIFVVPNRWLSL